MIFPLIAFSKPSFDCAKATTKVEKTICSDDELAELDLELSKVYSEKRSLANVKSSQKKWIKNRNKIGCLAPSGWVLKILEVEDYLFHNYKKQLLDGENHANYTS